MAEGVQVKAHPLADLFPMMEGEPFRELCESIRTNGLIHPIIRDNGVIVDGRNRQLACNKTGKAPHYREFSDLKLTISLEDYIWVVNGPRRNLTPDQKALIQASYTEMVEKLKAEGLQAKAEGGKSAGVGRPQKVLANSPKAIPPVRSRKALAAQAGVSEHKIRQAQAIADQPELLEQVKAGTLALKDAVKQVEQKENKRLPNIQKANKRRMVLGLSSIGGACSVLEVKVDIALVRAICSEEEIENWSKEAAKCSAILRKFGHQLKGESNGA